MICTRNTQFHVETYGNIFWNLSSEVGDSFRWVSSLCFGCAGIKRGHLAAFFLQQVAPKPVSVLKYSRSMNITVIINYMNRIEDIEDAKGECESWRKTMKPRNQAQDGARFDELARTYFGSN